VAICLAHLEREPSAEERVYMMERHLVEKEGIWTQEVARERVERLTGEEMDLVAKEGWRDACKI